MAIGDRASTQSAAMESNRQLSGTLVVGASGFLGPWVLEAAQRLDGRVWAASPSTAPSGAAFTDAPVAPASVDLAEPGEAEALLDRTRPARVVNLAAIASIAACAADPALARRVNAEAPGALATWCARHGARLVHISTDLVFGVHPAPPGGFDEDATPAPIGAYGESKAAGERAVLAAFPEALVVRLPLMYGDSRGRGLGASDGLLSALERGPFTLFEDEWRTPLCVAAAAEALVELAAGSTRGILHVAGPERLSRLEFGHAVLAAAGPSAAGRAAPVASTRAAAGLAERAEDASLASGRARALLQTELPAPAAGLARWAAARRRAARRSP